MSNPEIELLKLQRDRYRSMQNSMPKDCSAWIACKVTADEMQKSIDFLASLDAAP